MARLFPNEIRITEHRRKIAIRFDDGSEELAFFHKWTNREDCGDCALVEMKDGTMKYCPVRYMRFLPVDNEISAKELEKIYRECGVLK